MLKLWSNDLLEVVKAEPFYDLNLNVKNNSFLLDGKPIKFGNRVINYLSKRFGAKDIREFQSSFQAISEVEMVIKDSVVENVAIELDKFCFSNMLYDEQFTSKHKLKSIHHPMLDMITVICVYDIRYVFGRYSNYCFVQNPIPIDSELYKENIERNLSTERVNYILGKAQRHFKFKRTIFSGRTVPAKTVMQSLRGIRHINRHKADIGGDEKTQIALLSLSKKLLEE